MQPCRTSADGKGAGDLGDNVKLASVAGRSACSQSSSIGRTCVHYHVIGGGFSGAKILHGNRRNWTVGGPADL